MSDNSQPIDFPLVLASGVQDMKSSLSMLLSTLENLADAHGPVDEEGQKLQATLQYEASRINSELFQLQTVHKLSTHDLVPQIDEVYVQDVFEEQLANCYMLMSSRGIDVNIQCDPDLKWYFDQELIGGIIYKTLVNCSRYSRSTIQLEAEVKDDFLHVLVSDDGAGYPQFMLTEATAVVLPEQFNSTQLDFYCSNAIARLHTKGDVIGGISLNNGGALSGGVFEVLLP